MCHICIWENKFTARKLTRTLSLRDSLSLFNNHLNGVSAKRYKDEHNCVAVKELRVKNQRSLNTQPSQWFTTARWEAEAGEVLWV